MQSQSIAFTPASVDRFWSKVNKNGPVPPHRPELGPCWVWIGSRSWGYGRLSIGGQQYRAHRVAWELANGPIPDGLWALHRCDNPPCVRAGHLFLGTHADNVSDRAAKGREATGERHSSKTHPESVVRGDLHWTQSRPENLARGEVNGQAKLTVDLVRYIRRQVEAGVTQHALARELSIARRTVSRIVERETWAHV